MTVSRRGVTADFEESKRLNFPLFIANTIPGSGWNLDPRRDLDETTMKGPRSKVIGWLKVFLLQWCNPLRHPTDHKAPRGI